MYVPHGAFEEPPNPDAPLWRYMDFTKSASLLDRQALYFARADKLGDKFEGSSSKLIVENRPVVLRGMPEEARALLPRFYEANRRYQYVCCWHWNEYESAAMWRAYLTNE